MDVPFYKYQAAGNDFILVDNRSGLLSFSNEEISHWCHRRFGLGADGIILLEKVNGYDFRMVYHNSDGSISFCGNGCRAAVHFARHLGMIKDTARFLAHDGEHEAFLLSDGRIRFSLRDVSTIERRGPDFYINTGTDHHVRFVKDLAQYPVVQEGKAVRYSAEYPLGTNVNFVEVTEAGKVSFRIYERGVEDETFSSGSGATACALVVAYTMGTPSPIKLSAPGGQLEVEFVRNPDGGFGRVYLTGPVSLVFETRVKH
jgi:diaminopimelate epimerase